MEKKIGDYTILIDESSRHLFELYHWIIQKPNIANGSSAYVYRLPKRDTFGKRKRIYLHREIIGATNSDVVDHINRNTLDNRCANLRIASKSQNQWNKIGTSLTGYKGVSYDKYAKSFQAKITIDGKTISLGRRRTAAEAYELYVAAAKKHYGEFARFDCKDKQGI